MNHLLLAAALTNSISFNVTHQGEIYTITPQVTMSQSCQCRVSVETKRKGPSGQSTSRQQSLMVIPPETPLSLAKLVMNASPDDEVVVTVDISDGKDVNLSKMWSLNGQKT